MKLSLEIKRLIEDIIQHAETLQSAEGFAEDQRKKLYEKIKEYRKHQSLR